MFASIRQNALISFIAGGVILSATLLWADQADDQYAVAAAHYDQGRWKLAVDEFQAFLRDYPHDARQNKGLFLLGEAFLQLGNFDQARARFLEYIESDPSGTYARAALFRAGEAAYLVGNHNAAKADLERFQSKYPRDQLNAFVFPYLGEIGLAAGDSASAARLFREGLERFPEGKLQDDCRVGLARAMENQNQPQEAERLYLAVAGKADSPLADAAQFRLGALRYAAGRYREALECFSVFEERFVRSPWRPNAQLGGGLALLKLDRPAEAEIQFDAVLAGDSAGEELHRQSLCGKVQAALQRKDHAAVDRLAAEFEKRFPQSPTLAAVRRMAARSLVERKEYARTAAALEALLAAAPDGAKDLEGRYLLALAYDGLNRREDALAALQPVVGGAAAPLKADAQLLQGSLLLSQKKYAEAIPPLEALLSGNPTADAEAKALGELAICYARTKQLDKAKNLYAKLSERHPRSPLLAPTTEHLAEAVYDAGDAAWSAELSTRLAALGNSAEYDFKGKLGLGWSRYKAGKLAEAAETFDALLKSDKNPPPEIAAEAAFVRGRILEELGRDEPALEMYDLVIQRHPASKQRRDALWSAALLCGKLKQPRQAASYYERLVQDYPQSEKLDSVLYEWAWASRELGDERQAQRLFQRIRDECPQSRFRADATYRIAERAFEEKDFDRAGGLVEELLKADVDPSVRQYALDLRGQLAVARSDWLKVREAFQTLLKEFPDTSRRLVAECGIAEADYHQGDLVAASAKLEQLDKQVNERREPWMAIVPLRRAQILARANRWEEAYAIASRIEEDFPDFPQQYEVDYLLGRCLANRADFQSARQAYNKVIRSTAGAKTETAAMAQWMIGETFFHQKNYKDAAGEYLRLEPLYAYPNWQAAALLQAGKCYELLGEQQPAANLFRRILEKYPQTTFAEQAKRKLDGPSKADGD